MGLIALQAQSGDVEGAVASYTDLGAIDEANALCYTAAQQAEAAGDMEAAALWYTRCGSYLDAPAQAERLQAGYLVPRRLGTEAMAAGNWSAAVEALSQVDFDSLPDAQADLLTMYLRACRMEGLRLKQLGQTAEAAAMLSRTEGYPLPEELADVPDVLRSLCRQLGLELAESGSGTEALPYLLRVRDDPDVAPFFAEDPLWQLLGQWTCTGHTYQFNADQTCDLDGVRLCYTVQEDQLLTGPDMDTLTASHTLAQVEDRYMMIRPNGGATLNMNRTGSCTLPPLP